MTDDATVTASSGELRFAGAQCKRFAFSFSLFAFVSWWKPRVRGVAFSSSFAFALRHSSPPSSSSSRRIDLKLTKFLAFGSGVVSFRMKSTLVVTDIGIVLSVFLEAVAGLEFCYLEMRVAGKACVIEQ